MANESKLTTLGALKKLAEETKEQLDGISVPEKVSDLDNDSGFQTKAEVLSAIQEAIAKTGHAQFEKADEAPADETAKDNVLYLVKNKKTNHYDIYAKIDGHVEWIDDTVTDLSGYPTTEDVEGMLNGYVPKEGSKVLSTNDYTTADKDKLAAIQAGATAVEKSDTNGNVKINGEETTVYELPETVIQGEIASDGEVSAMLESVFGA